MLDTRDRAIGQLLDGLEGAPEELRNSGLIDGVDDALAVLDLLLKRHVGPKVGDAL